MKRFLLISIYFLFAGIIAAQNYSLFDGDTDVTNDTITVTIDSGTDPAVTHIKVTNNAGSGVSMKVKKIENFLVEGTTVALCWGINCYGPSVFTCPNTVSIAASATDESFRGDYSHGNISGTSIITYVFFNENDANDSCYVVVKYDNGTTSIPSLNLQIAEPYPNPAQGFISFDNQNAVFGMSLSVYNTLGKRLKVIRLEGANGITLVNTSDLDPGMYFYEYFDGTSVIKNGKFFVTR